MEDDLVYFPVVELPQPITFRRARKTFTHFRAAAFAVGGDYPDIKFYGIRDEWVGIEPQLSIRLQEGATATQGLVSVIDYMPFALRDRSFSDGTPDVTPFLVPENYRVARGDSFCDDNRLYGGGGIEVGGPQDRGDLAIVTVRALAATADVFGAYNPQQLLDVTSNNPK
jgi:hypothetical protein